jgi:glycosyltransferase involved in cell wall biosynthesis
MGRSSPQKDPLTLYRAFARAAAGDASVHLFHVGRGELDSALERLAGQLGIAGRVTRLPSTAEPGKFYQAIDGFILPSKYEGFSLALLEALSADLPLIVSDAPGNRDLAAESLSHLAMAAPGDAVGFANAISAWAASTRSGARTNHRAIARSRFELEDHLRDVAELYERLAESAPRRAAVLRPV